MMQSQLSVSQVLFDGFRTRDGLKLAKLGRDSAALDTYNAQQTVLNDATSAYLTVLRMESLQDVALSGLKSAQAHLQQAQNRMKSGVGTRFEVLQAQTQLANVRGQVRKAQNGVELARLSLFNTLRVPASNDKLQQVPPLPRVDFDERDIHPAIDGRPEVQQLALKQNVDQATLDLNSRSYLPTVAGMGSFSMQGAGSSRYWLAGITAQWAAFDGGKTKAKIAQSRADIERDKTLIEQTKNLLMLDIQKSIRDRDEARDRLEIAEEGLQFAKESFRLSEARYTSGIGTSLEVLDSQSQLTQAEQNRIGAYYDLQLAEVKLAKSLGIDLRTYLPGIRKG
jgi:OMF family outer membrane factor